MNIYMCRLFLVAVCAFLFLSSAQGKDVSGTVTDPSGAVVAGATVSITSGGRPLTSTLSDERGRFTLSLKDSDCHDCELICSASGFSTLSQPIDLSPTKPEAMMIRLDIAVPSETVSVESRAQPWVEQLDLSEVRESAAMDVGQALSEVPGITKLRKGGIDNDIVVRGLQHDNVNVSIDGARIYGACPGHMDPAVSHTDFSEVERVDVNEGAFDVTSSGSLGAKVNIVMRKPPVSRRLRPGRRRFTGSGR